MTRTVLVFLMIMLVFTGFSQRLLYDEANILKPDERDLVSKKLNEIHAQRGVDIYCYIPNSLKGKTPDQFTMEKGDQLKVGTIGLNNGIFMLILPKEEEVYITGAFGVQWILTDQKINTIIDALLGPFKAKEYKEGILKGLGMIDQALNGYSFKVSQANLNKTDFSKLKGKVIAFEYFTTYSNTHFRIPVANDSEFNAAFSIDIMSGSGKVADLFYNKYMGDMVKAIMASKKRLIFARVRNANPLQFELLGFMNF